MLDLARPDGLAVEVDAAEAADVLMSVWAICGRDEYDTLDAGRARLEEIQASVPPDLLAEIDDLVRGEAKIPAHLLGPIRPPNRGAPAAGRGSTRSRALRAGSSTRARGDLRRAGRRGGAT